MKIYINKSGERFEIIKETTTQSILTDLATMLVVMFIFGIDFLFAYYIHHSWVLDIFTVIMFIAIVSMKLKKKIKIETKEDLIKIINNL